MRRRNVAVEEVVEREKVQKCACQRTNAFGGRERQLVLPVERNRSELEVNLHHGKILGLPDVVKNFIPKTPKTSNVVTMDDKALKLFELK